MLPGKNFVGLDIGGTSIKGIMTTQDGTILDFCEMPTWSWRDGIAGLLNDLIRSLLHRGNCTLREIRAVGIGTAGSIDKEKGMVITSPNIPSLSRYPLVETVKKITAGEVFLENDATAAVMGEWWKGYGKNYSNWILLTLGTGIGGGCVLDNKLYTGRFGSAMEVGHMTIDYRGRKCPCGSRGCLETYSSATSLVKYAKRLLRRHPESSLSTKENDRIDSRVIEEEALKGDSLSLILYERISTWLGLGISNLVNIFNPEAIILGGGLSRAHRLMFPVIKKVVHDNVMEGLDVNLQYHAMEDPLRTPSLGAAKIAIDAVNGKEV